MGETDGKKKKAIVAIFLLSGVISTFGNDFIILAYKLQGVQLVDEGEHHNKKFFHPYMQSLTMFIGESLCLIAFFSQGKKARLPL